MQVCYKLIALLLLITAGGCGSSDSDVVQLTGKVVFNGKPVPAGYIILDPDLKSGNDGRQGYADIKDGVYDTSTSAKGVTGGKYIARIHGFVPPPVGGRPQVLFRDYQQGIKIAETSSTHDFDVPAAVGVKPNTTLAPIN